MGELTKEITWEPLRFEKHRLTARAQNQCWWRKSTRHGARLRGCDHPRCNGRAWWPIRLRGWHRGRDWHEGFLLELCAPCVSPVSLLAHHVATRAPGPFGQSVYS